jgi:hypothetical protein
MFLYHAQFTLISSQFNAVVRGHQGHCPILSLFHIMWHLRSDQVVSVATLLYRPLHVIVSGV